MRVVFGRGVSWRDTSSDRLIFVVYPLVGILFASAFVSLEFIDKSGWEPK